MNENIIFEKKYPPIDPMKEWKSPEPETASGHAEIHLTFDELVNKITKNTTLVPLPEREESGKEFIRLAIEVSEIYEISVKIERGADRITVEYYFNGGGCWREINRVFGMADEIAFFKDTDGFDITVVLDYFTHATVRRGKVISP